MAVFPCNLRWRWKLEILLRDIRYGLRMLLRKPGFTAVAIIALALGIGANTAIFSVVNAVLLRPLPYEQSERLVGLWENNPQQGVDNFNVSYPNLVEWQEQNQVFEQIAGYSFIAPTLTQNAESGKVAGALISA